MTEDNSLSFLFDKETSDIEKEQDNQPKKVVITPSRKRINSSSEEEITSDSALIIDTTPDEEENLPSHIREGVPRIKFDDIMDPSFSPGVSEDTIYKVTEDVRDIINKSDLSNEIPKIRNNYKSFEHRSIVVKLIEIINAETSKKSFQAKSKSYLKARVFNNIAGLGPLEPLASNKAVTEIICNGPNKIYIETRGAIIPVPGVKFRNPNDLMELCLGMLSDINRTISSKDPIADGRLPDKSRINVVHTDIAPSGPVLTIRRHSGERWTLRKLAENGALTDDMVRDLVYWIRAGLTTVAVGSTGSGKALTLDTEIPTPDINNHPSGFIKMGELKVGDRIFGADGNPTVINGVYDQGLEEVYAIEFDDGSVVEASGEHLWEVWDYTQRRKIQADYKKNRNRAPMVDERMKKFVYALSQEDFARNRTEEMSEDFKNLFTGDEMPHYENSLEISFEAEETSLNDSKNSDEISEEDLLEFVKNYNKQYSSDEKNNTSYTIAEFLPESLAHYTRRVTEWCKKDYSVQAEDSQSASFFETEKNRFSGIEIVLSISSRLNKSLYDQRNELTPHILTVNEILENGLTAKSGHRNYGVKTCKPLNYDLFTSPQPNSLFNSIEEREEYVKSLLSKDDLTQADRESLWLIASSLGYKVKESSKGTSVSEGFRAIKSIKSIGEKQTRCIKVSAEDSLFLCTRNMIPTHNTTVLNAMSGAIPENVHIITIEDNLELNLNEKLDVVSLEARPPSATGSGEVSIRTLVRNALRMRPDRIVVGEVRGGEAYDMIQAMNTGHNGSLTTFHANGAEESMNRLESLIAQANLVKNIKPLISSALDLLVVTERFHEDGKRRITGIYEVLNKFDNSKVEISPLWVFEANFTTDGEDNGVFVKKNDLSEKTKHRYRLKINNLTVEEAYSLSD